MTKLIGIKKKVVSIENEALLGVVLSCAKYVIDTLDKDKNTKLFLLAKKVVNHFTKGARYVAKDAKEINKILTDHHNPILNIGYNPGAMFIVLTNYLVFELNCPTTINILQGHNLPSIKKLELSLSYYYIEHYKYANKVLEALTDNISQEELIMARDKKEEPKPSISKFVPKITFGESYFQLDMINKNLLEMFCLDYGIEYDFSVFQGTKVIELDFHNSHLDNFKLFIKNSLEENPEMKELIFLHNELNA